MNILRSIRKFLSDTSQSAKITSEIREGIDNQSVTLNHQLSEIREGVDNQSAMLNRKLTELIEGVKRQTEVMNNKMNKQIEILQTAQDISLKNLGSVNNGFQAPPKPANTFEDALKQHPLMFAHKTFNTNHPDYDATEARNFPGKIFNIDKDPGNLVYGELKKLIHGDEISEQRWSVILNETLEEAKTVPHADQVFQRKAFVEKYLEDLETQNSAFYRPGWVNLDDALFLYWVVRRLKPKVIVQTGVCNGLSSAFMMLALAKNGLDGTLHVVDMPPVYDSKDADWKVKGKVYGVVIPEGKNSGWLVPDAYKDRFEVLSGDAKLLLPGLLKKLGKVDMFYHDSDHTYDHMMFEFKEAKTYLTKSGVIVSDDISWNASLWDFADEYVVPAYNYRGSMGIACF